MRPGLLISAFLLWLLFTEIGWVAAGLSAHGAALPRYVSWVLIPSQVVFAQLPLPYSMQFAIFLTLQYLYAWLVAWLFSVFLKSLRNEYQ